MPMRPKNWSTFQHYKDRRPPWIRLYHHLVDQAAWWALKGDDAQSLVIVWLIASEHENGQLPELSDLAFRLRMPIPRCEQFIKRIGAWLEQTDNRVLAEPEQIATPEERRGRGREEAEGESSPHPQAPYDQSADPEQNIPDGMAPMQYACFVLDCTAIPASNGLRLKMADAIGMLARLEECTWADATKRMLDRIREAQRDGPFKANFWLEEGKWKKTEAFSLGLQDD